MKIIDGDILKIREVSGIEVKGVCFTANKVINKRGLAVMGAGVARVFRDFFTSVDIYYGDVIRLNGSNTTTTPLGFWDVGGNEVEVIAFPTKNHWSEMSYISIIEQSSIDLRELINSRLDLQKGIVLLPKPGCGLGQLEWSDVEKVIAPILPDNVVIVEYKV